MARHRSRTQKAELIEVHPDLLEILNKIKEQIKEYSWGAVEVSNYQATKVLSEKWNKSKLN